MALRGSFHRPTTAPPSLHLTEISGLVSSGERVEDRPIQEKHGRAVGLDRVGGCFRRARAVPRYRSRSLVDSDSPLKSTR